MFDEETTVSSEITSTGPPPNRPTMRDVAKLAGVALKTVSRVFNNVPSVDPELARRTREAAAKLGYRPNLTASALRRLDGRTATVGLLLEDVGNPFSAALHRAVENVARSRGSLVLTGSLDEDPARERELANALLDRQVDGLIIVPAGQDHSYLAADQRNGLHVVFLDRPPVMLWADAVTADNTAGARLAVDHLLADDHRRIAYLGDRTSIHTAQARYDGYREALELAGRTVDPTLVRHDLRTVTAAAAAVTDLLALGDPPSAMFTSQNLVTIGAAQALRAANRQHTVGLVGFDDFLLADALDPPITVIAQDAPTMGRLAAELLFAQLDGQGPTGTIHLVPTRLVVRGSGEIPGPPPRC